MFRYFLKNSCVVNVKQNFCTSRLTCAGKRNSRVTAKAKVVTSSSFAASLKDDLRLNPYIFTPKPRTPGLRHVRRIRNPHVWMGRPWRKLTCVKKGHAIGGRNHTGHVTVRHRGNPRHRKRLRTVDFERNSSDAPHLVVRIERDPGRSAHIALIVELLPHESPQSFIASVTQNSPPPKNAICSPRQLRGRHLSYILAAEGLRAGDIVQSWRNGVPQNIVREFNKSSFQSHESISQATSTLDPGYLAAKALIRGNCVPIHMVPVGTEIFNIGSHERRGGVFCRSAGTYATVVNHDSDGTGPSTIKVQSGEIRYVSRLACATIGIASNALHNREQLGKAGRARWLGRRPTVRGVAMNACDHPHGGGRGKSKGNRIPVSPWGKQAKSGKKTRKRALRWVVKERPRNFGARRKREK